MALIFVTSNPFKFEEVREIAERHGVEIVQRSVPYVEIQADELEDVVKPGVQQACRLLGAPCFIEDAGLFVDALNGFPGPYSKFVFLTIGNQGLLKLMESKTDRRAEFRSAVGYCAPKEKPMVFAGRVRGTLALKARGTHGFGFDPIFLAENAEKTFAEMETSEKNKFSHRGQAIEKFFEWYTRGHRS